MCTGDDKGLGVDLFLFLFLNAHHKQVDFKGTKYGQLNERLMCHMSRYT